MSDGRARDLLKEGIAAARAGEQAHARLLLREAAAADPCGEAAWLWLAGAAESPQEALGYLERLLALHPTHGQARAAHRSARLQAGIAAARAKDRAAARSLLRAAVLEEPGNEMALVWLATVAETPQESVAFLERVLEINPTNDRAREGLEHYRGQFTPPAPAPTRPAEPAHAPAEPMPAWRCPLCDAEAVDEDPRRCDNCGAVVKLDDPEAFARLEDRDTDLFAAAIARLEGAGRPDDFDACYHLGLAYLNARQFDRALPRLRAAARLRTGDRDLAARVEALARILTPDEARPPAAGPTVLVADGSADVRQLASRALEGEGYQARAAADGREAVELIRDGGAPDLILLDADLPGTGGYQLCKFLRENHRTAGVPIILLSESDGFLSRMRGQLAGSAEQLAKPFEPDELLRVVGRHCPLAETAAVAEAAEK